MSDGGEPENDCCGHAYPVVAVDADDVDGEDPGLLLALEELLVHFAFEPQPELDAEVRNEVEEHADADGDAGSLGLEVGGHEW